ncbi:unnamed protein product [Brassica oleracea]
MSWGFRYNQFFKCLAQLGREIDKVVSNQIASTRYFEKLKLHFLLQK